MDEKKNEFMEWVKSHRKHLAVAGISVVAITGIVIGLRNRKEVVDLWSSLMESIKNEPKQNTITLPDTDVTQFEVTRPTRIYTPPQKPVVVPQHIRTLSDGKHHSVEKEIEARAMGISLKPNETWVNSYTKYAA